MSELHPDFDPENESALSMWKLIFAAGGVATAATVAYGVRRYKNTKRLADETLALKQEQPDDGTSEQDA